MMPHHVFGCQADDSLPLLPGDRFSGIAELAAVARLHFNKHQRRSVARDDVQFAATAPVPPRNNCVPAALELAAREIFAGFPEKNTVARHVARFTAITIPTPSNHEGTKNTKSRLTRR